MKNMGNLLKQASQMQARMQELQAKLEAATLEGQSGAGMVKIVLTGKGDVKSVAIDPKLADPNEMEMLQDLIVAAFTDAKRKMEAAASEEMSKLTGGLQLPPGMKLPF